jgi:uncharacterized protein
MEKLANLKGEKKFCEEGFGMRLDDLDPSDNVRDLGRGGGFSGGGFGGGGGGGGLIGILFSVLPMLLGRKMGCGTVLIIGAVIAFFMFSGGLQQFSGGGGGSGTSQQSGQQSGAGGNVACDTQAEQVACRVLGSTELVWSAIFTEVGQKYPAPTLNFFTNSNQSGCGPAQSAMGPFYCPADQGVYLDTAFFAELEQKFGAAGDAAQAYVIAHEVGHHIQTISGDAERIRKAQSGVGQAQANGLQVRMELQADCYAGVWAARARGKNGQPLFERGDFEEAMRAAQAIGDDTLQRSAGQRPVPESFTHGSSEQRMSWLRRGMETGNPAQCNTFAGVL